MADNSHAHRKIRKRSVYPYGMSDAICRAEVEQEQRSDFSTALCAKPAGEQRTDKAAESSRKISILT